MYMMNSAAWHEVIGVSSFPAPKKKQSPEKRSPKIFPIKKMFRFFGWVLFRIRFPSQALRKLQLKSVDDEVGQFFFSLVFGFVFSTSLSQNVVFWGRFISAESVPIMCHIYMYMNY